MQLSVRMSAVVSMSMNQSSSFEKSCQSNVGISCTMVMVRFDSLCVVYKVSMYACMVLCTSSLLGCVAECSWSIIVRCCSLYVGLFQLCHECRLGSGKFPAGELVLKAPELL